MKYRVHVFCKVRVPFVVEADSPQAAMEKAAEQFSPNDVRDGEYCNFLDQALVDPLLADGEVDYNNSTWLELP